MLPSLEHHQSCVLLIKTPTKTQDHPWVDVSQPRLRTLTTGSERSNRERPSLPVRILSILKADNNKINLNPSSELSNGSHSLAVASVQRVPNSLPLASVLRVTQFPLKEVFRVNGVLGPRTRAYKASIWSP